MHKESRRRFVEKEFHVMRSKLAKSKWTYI